MALFFDGMVLKSEHECKELLGDRYFKVNYENAILKIFQVNPDLAAEIPMDDPAQVPTLVSVAESLDLFSALQWIKRTIYKSDL